MKTSAIEIFYYIIFKGIRKCIGSTVLSSEIHSSSKIEAGSNIANTTMDRHSFCGYNCEITNCDIGAFCSIANNVKIGGGMHPMEWVSTSPVFYEGRDSVKAKFSKHKRTAHKRTTIGNDVWIGEGALVKQGIVIGDGAIVGMGSIVTRDVQPYSIVAGNPAREIRKRFDEKVIEALQEERWWEYDDEKLRVYAKYFNNVGLYLKRIEK